MPNGQSLNIKHSLCNMPEEIMDVRTFLPRQANSNGLATITFKRKLEYWGHVYFEPFRADMFWDCCRFLKVIKIFIKI